MRRMIGAVLLLAGCASAQTGIPAGGGTRQVTRVEGAGGRMEIEQTVDRNVLRSTLPVTAEAAWSALPAVYAELGIPVTTTDPAMRLIGAQDQRLRRFGKERPSRFLDCGSGPAGENADQYQVYLTVLTQLHPAGDGSTEVRTQLAAQARNPSHGSPPVRCGSNGELERRILEELRKRLGVAAP